MFNYEERTRYSDVIIPYNFYAFTSHEYAAPGEFFNTLTTSDYGFTLDEHKKLWFQDELGFATCVDFREMENPGRNIAFDFIENLAAFPVVGTFSMDDGDVEEIVYTPVVAVKVPRALDIYLLMVKEAREQFIHRNDVQVVCELRDTYHYHVPKESRMPSISYIHTCSNVGLNAVYTRDYGYWRGYESGWKVQDILKIMGALGYEYMGAN